MSHGAHGRISVSLQYSTKEDKYEEEIKLLGEKLKEVRLILGPHGCSQGNNPRLGG